MNSAKKIIKKLALQPHPEGGYYRRTYLQVEEMASSIYYLLEYGDKSHWHTISFDELLFFHCGSPLDVQIISNGKLNTHIMGNNILDGEQAQIVVPANSILAMSINSDQPDSYTLISCVVTPQFKFEEFKLLQAQELIEQFPEIDQKVILQYSIK